MSIAHDLLERRHAFVAGRISRRRFAAALAGVGLVTATVLARPSPAGAGEATVFTWSEYEGEGYVADYAAKHGRRPNSPSSSTRRKPSPNSARAFAPMW